MQTKRELILDAMETLMNGSSAQAISVEEIAQKAGIGKGSIYYYFSSKNDIIDGVFQRACARILAEGKSLAAAPGMDCFQKMEIIYRTCLDSFKELRRQEEASTFHDIREHIFMHQKSTGIIISSLMPLLTDILKEGIREGSIRCQFPEETARIILTVLTVTLDNTLLPAPPEQLADILDAFAAFQETGLGIPPGRLTFLTENSRP